MKKSLTAVAILGAFAGASFAADVTLYGVVDYGMFYQGQEIKNLPLNADINALKYADDRASKLGLDSGINAGSRFGIKGSEDLGNGLTLSFKLENGFNADDGTMGQDNRLFGREASMTLSGNFGKLSAGRIGALGSAAGSYDTVFAIGDAFDGGDNAIFGMVTTSRLDNAIVYQSPKVAGLQATMQYSFKNDNKVEAGREGHKDAARYAGFALTGEYGNLQTVAAYEQRLLADRQDEKIVSVGANYDLGVTKLFAMGQYFENLFGETRFEQFDNREITAPFRWEDVDGTAFHIGAVTPLFGGELTTGAYYLEADEHEPGKLNYLGAAARYTYALSQRTSVYTGVGYGEWEIDNEGAIAKNQTLKTTQAYVGLTHAF